MIKNDRNDAVSDLKTLTFIAYFAPFVIFSSVYDMVIRQEVNWSKPHAHLTGIPAIVFSLAIIVVFVIIAQVSLNKKAFAYSKLKYSLSLLLKLYFSDLFIYVLIITTAINIFIRYNSIPYYLIYECLLLAICFLFQWRFYKRFFKKLGIDFKPEKIRLKKKHL